MRIKVEEMDLQKIINRLNEGKIIIYPTETSYGLGCSIAFPDSIKKIYKIKQRNTKKPLIVLIDSIETIKPYVKITPDIEKLVKAFMPGPLTLISESTIRVPKELNSDSGKLAFRISSNKTANSICRVLRKPLISTSVNIEGEPEIYDSGKLEMFEDLVDIILDSGNLPKTPVSTVFDVLEKKVLRKGIISEKEILKVLENK